MSEHSDARYAEVCDAFERGASAADLIDRFPEMAGEIIDAALWLEATGPFSALADEQITPEPGGLADSEAGAVQLMLRVAREMQDQGAATRFAGIFARCREIGIGPAVLASRLRLGMAVLTKLDRRLIDPTSIPDRAVQCIATALKVSRESVEKYLALGPTLSFGASYRAPAAPALALQEPRGSYAADEGLRAPSGSSAGASATRPQQQSFRSALASAPDLTDEERRVWLTEGEPEARQS